MNGTRIGTDFKLGSTITYQCDSGYKIIDPSTITCVIGTDGKPAWNRALPSCNGIYYYLTISLVYPALLSVYYMCFWTWYSGTWSYLGDRIIETLLVVYSRDRQNLMQVLIWCPSSMGLKIQKTVHTEIHIHIYTHIYIHIQSKLVF